MNKFGAKIDNGLKTLNFLMLSKCDESYIVEKLYQSTFTCKIRFFEITFDRYFMKLLRIKLGEIERILKTIYCMKIVIT